MADLSQTAANVALSSGTKKGGTYGDTITAGMPLYQDASDSDHLKPADAEDTAAKAVCIGIALNNGADGQPGSYAPSGSVVNLGVTLTVGTIYVLSAAGKIAPSTDLASGDYVTVLGVATTAALLQLTIINSGVEVP